jgi:hypothetical protein
MRCAVLGAERGALNHLSWTRGRGIPWHSPEYVLTVHALRSVWRSKLPLILFCEEHARDAIYQSGGLLAGRYPAVLGESSRADIIIFNKNLEPKGIIEAKRGVWNVGRIVKDTERLAHVLRRKGTIRFGIILFTTGCTSNGSGGRQQTLERRLLKWTDQGDSSESPLARICKGDIKMRSSHTPIRSWTGDGPGGYKTFDWCAGAIMLTRRRAAD